MKHKTLKCLTALITYIVTSFLVGIVTIEDEFGDDYAFLSRKNLRPK